MYTNEIQSVLNYVRCDGVPDGSEITFLTIEDGGDLIGYHKIQNKNEFFSLICDPNSNIYTRPRSDDDEREIQNISLTKHFGRPGIVISKLMACIQYNDISRWEEYGQNQLYQSDAQIQIRNIKYYPLGRPKQNLWPLEYKKFLGLEWAEYMAICRSNRTDILLKHKILKFLETDRYIILGAIAEWRTLLDRIFPSTHEQSGSSDIPKDLCSFHHNSDNRLCFATLPIFKHGLRNDIIKSFAEYIKREWTFKV